jgi:hypothetical protein
MNNPFLFQNVTTTSSEDGVTTLEMRSEITLRDVFAGIALLQVAGTLGSAEAEAEEAYAYAEAMLRVREKRT